MNLAKIHSQLDILMRSCFNAGRYLCLQTLFSKASVQDKLMTEQFTDLNIDVYKRQIKDCNDISYLKRIYPM